MVVEILITIFLLLSGQPINVQSDVAWYGMNTSAGIVAFPISINGTSYFVMTDQCVITHVAEAQELKFFADAVSFVMEEESGEKADFIVRTLYMHPQLKTPVMQMYRNGNDTGLRLLQGPVSPYTQQCSLDSRPVLEGVQHS